MPTQGYYAVCPRVVGVAEEGTTNAAAAAVATAAAFLRLHGCNPLTSPRSCHPYWASNMTNRRQLQPGLVFAVA